MNRLKYIGLVVNVLIILVVIGSLLVVPMFRDANSGIIGRESYLYLRLAEDMSLQDIYSYGGKFAAYEWGLPLILSLNPGMLAKILPPIFGMLIVIMFYLLLRKINVKSRKLSVVMLVVSPTFIYLANTLNKYAPAVFLMLLAYYFVVSGNKTASILPSVFLPLFSWGLALVHALLMTIVAVWARQKQSMGAKYSLVAVLLSFGGYALFLIYNAGIPHLYNLVKDTFVLTFSSLFSDLGGKYGLSIFGTITAISGISKLWKVKYRHPEVFLSIFLLIVLAFFSQIAIFALVLFFAYLSAKGVEHLLERHWSDETLKAFTLIILLCGIVFSTVAYSKELVNSPPDNKTFWAIEILSQFPHGTVFSDYKNGYWISYARKNNIMDEQILFSPNVAERYKDIETLLNTRMMEDADPILSKYHVRYFWIDKRMKKEIWNNREEQGLQFLLKYGDFKRLYEDGEVEIWKTRKPAY